jgi:hypothetical protein
MMQAKKYRLSAIRRQAMRIFNRASVPAAHSPRQWQGGGRGMMPLPLKQQGCRFSSRKIIGGQSAATAVFLCPLSVYGSNGQALVGTPSGVPVSDNTGLLTLPFACPPFSSGAQVQKPVIGACHA